MAGKEWSPRVNYELVEKALIREIEETIRSTKELTRYEGPDYKFGDFVSDKTWDLEDYRYIGWNSGILMAYLDLADKLKMKLPEELVKQANHYVYE